MMIYLHRLRMLSKNPKKLVSEVSKTEGSQDILSILSVNLQRQSLIKFTSISENNVNSLNELDQAISGAEDIISENNQKKQRTDFFKSMIEGTVRTKKEGQYQTLENDFNQKLSDIKKELNTESDPDLLIKLEKELGECFDLLDNINSLNIPYDILKLQRELYDVKRDFSQKKIAFFMQQKQKFSDFNKDNKVTEKSFKSLLKSKAYIKI